MMTAANLRHAFEIILNPFLITMILFAFSLVWLYVRGDGYGVRGVLWFSFLSLYLLSTGWLPGALIYLFERQYEVVKKADPTVRWVAVFGGGHYEEYPGMPANEELTPISIIRLVEGVRLYRQISNAKLLLSGGPVGDSPGTDAGYLAIVASWFQIPKENIVLETTSLNTADEAIAIKKLIGNEPFYLVTSALHMPRAMALCRRQGLHPIAAPANQSFIWKNSHGLRMAIPNHSNISQFSAAWHEILGMIWGKVRGFM